MLSHMGRQKKIMICRQAYFIQPLYCERANIRMKSVTHSQVGVLNSFITGYLSFESILRN